MSLSPANNSNLISGGAEDDVLVGSAAADMLVGYAGDDTLAGGAGSDVLNGGAGSDVYVWRKGDGADRIVEWFGRSADTDVLSLADVASSGVTLTRVRGDLVLTVVATGETITIASQFLSPAFGCGLESIRFSDGVSWTRNDILAHTVVNGSAANERLAGTAFADTINGLAGDDVINGYAGDDRLTGGAGKDVLIGGAGSDTYVWRKGDGADRIVERFGRSADTDVLSLVDVASSGVTLTRNGFDLLLTVVATGETITIANQFLWSDFGGGLESIRFSDGVSWTRADILTHTVANNSAGSETSNGDWLGARTANGSDMLALDATSLAAPTDPIDGFSMAADNVLLARSVFAGQAHAGAISSDAFGSATASAISGWLSDGSGLAGNDSGSDKAIAADWAQVASPQRFG